MAEFRCDSVVILFKHDRIKRVYQCKSKAHARLIERFLVKHHLDVNPNLFRVEHHMLDACMFLHDKSIE